ncbi:MAG: DUF1971 domain-containing protein [bacterium]|nr:DUF1971 domain-containing protein [bacterium]
MSELYQTITEGSVRDLVNKFYRQVRSDEKLAPIFDAAIGTTDDKWEQHLEKIAMFWSGIMLGIKGFEGNPLQAHKALPAFDGCLFSRWLAIFANTAIETHGIDAATSFIRKAVSIADMMSRDLYDNPVMAPSMPELPANMKYSRTTPPFQAANIPDALRRAHRTAKNVHGRIVMTKGRLLYTIGKVQCHVLSRDNCGIIEPESLHFVTPLDDVEFVVEFYKDPLLSSSQGKSSS